MKIIAITNHKRDIIEHDWLARAEVVHRQLRPQLPVDYVARMKEIFAGGAEMAVAVVDDQLLGLAVFRMVECTFTGREMYCDDLVSNEKNRSTGIGHMLIAYMENLARERAANVVTLDSGTQRQQAHKFYFREEFTISSFHFSKSLQ